MAKYLDIQCHIFQCISNEFFRLESQLKDPIVRFGKNGFVDIVGENLIECIRRSLVANLWKLEGG
jgi:hypothetical protein